MERKERGAGDSHSEAGGEIPGSRGKAAYILVDPAPSALPVLLAVPHAGRHYPDELLQSMRNPGLAGLRLEDRHIDGVAKLAARRTSAALLVAHAPRAMIDLNRAPGDLDRDMVRGGDGGAQKQTLVGWRTRSGLGLIPRRLPGFGELWKGPLDSADVEARLQGVHVPYHRALGGALARMRARWGAALLLDIHSMPPLPARFSGAPAPVCVLGDRFSMSCSGGLAAAAFDYLSDAGLMVAHNRPYAGGYVLERHAAPSEGIHALQIEFCRSLYLDSQLIEPSEHLQVVADMLTGLVRHLAEQVAAMGHSGGSARRWNLAAE
ncbi:hypothetical protein MB02_12815 [Croceicoccus estronivorus]|uniref:N-formylglutamate amidohydrolase n=1 Tax=Croceicoccus estronivorus TaxID=1172626 RepID=UPI00083285F0|nr:N-formylglutamate amidohydrolase [Croceicoccus estronivorus]OCC23219.1 hypothetical protein MB02_12815 [Croceicoccus estronivorus]